jgi:RNA polymerase sigma-70 factor, ECF subfamily
VAGVADTQQRVPLRQLDPDDLGDHLDRLYRAAWAMCGNREDAEDLVQETYANVLSRSRWLRGNDDVGYLLRALRNAHVNRGRAAARRPRTSSLQSRADEPVAHAGSDPEVALEAGVLFAAIAALPPAFRDALVAIDVAGLSYREAARALRVREATITSRLHRARARIALELR